MTDRICAYCGQSGHRAHACRRRVIAEAADATRLPDWRYFLGVVVATVAASYLLA